MLRKLYKTLWEITNRDNIPKLPRGMLATKYNESDVSTEQWRVLHRIGARDPAGIKRAMKRHKVDNIPDLVALLEHHKPRHRFSIRLENAIGRVLGGHKRDPHADDVRRAFKKQFDDHEHIVIKERIQKARQIYES